MAKFFAMTDYAVFECGGKQYRAALGGFAVVDRLGGEVGASVRLDKVLAIADKDGKTAFGAPYLPDAINATIVGHMRGDKVRTVKMRRRKNSRTTMGGRADLTRIRLEATTAKEGGQ
ncbi:MAG: 50S ribosomal protein L21 [Gammaproteobacteria bacterium]